jgi:hypothetical protein
MTEQVCKRSEAPLYFVSSHLFKEFLSFCSVGWFSDKYQNCSKAPIRCYFLTSGVFNQNVTQNWFMLELVKVFSWRFD